MTFQRPADASPEWPGLPHPEVAAPLAISAYLRVYGPAPSMRSDPGWRAGGYFSKRPLRAWQAAMGDRIAEARVDGDEAFVLAQDLDDRLGTAPSATIRLLPGFDQWIMGPGTDATSIVPAALRSAVSRQSGWIAPVVIRGGVVTGTWTLDGSTIRIDWFTEAGRPPDHRSDALRAETQRWAAIVGRDLDVEVIVSRDRQRGWMTVG